MQPEKLFIHNVPKDIGQSLSALVPIGADFWLGADEGTSLARANAEGGIDGKSWDTISTVDLIPGLDLPGKKPKKKKKPSDPDEFPEADIEGMAWDDRHLWVVGSHSLKRTQPKEKKSDAENFERLAEVEADGNRYLLGRLPIDQEGDILEPNAATADHCAARLPCDLFTSALLDELREDELFARFLPSAGAKSPEHNLPGKDNGLDIEGLAAVGRDHLLVGLRGPVFRSWALALELRLTCGEPPADGTPATLQLQMIGKRKYRRIAFGLDGLGIRDICFDENGDLLILAGPTMVLPWPVTIFRWPGAREKLAVNTDDRFVWRTELKEEHCYSVDAADRAESLCVLGTGPSRRLVVGYDNTQRLTDLDPATGTGTLILDAFDLT